MTLVYTLAGVWEMGAVVVKSVLVVVVVVGVVVVVVVGVVRVAILDDMVSENIWFPCPKSSTN